MTYDAVLVARRGLGADEIRLIDPRFLAAVRFALFAEQLGEGISELRAAVERPIKSDEIGPDAQAFMALRKSMRDDLAARDAALYPPDGDA